MAKSTILNHKWVRYHTNKEIRNFIKAKPTYPGWGGSFKIDFTKIKEKTVTIVGFNTLATEMLVSIVLNLKTIGPLFYKALINQDMYLASTILLVISVILVIGNLVADVVLAWVDPRIRLELR